MTALGTVSKLSTATWLILAGLALAVPSGVAAALLAGSPPGIRSVIASADPTVAALRAVVGLGVLTFLVGLVLYVVVPSLTPAAAARSYASYRTMLTMLAVAAIPANLISLVYLVLARPGPSAGPTPGTLIVSIAALELALLGVLYLRIIGPGVLTWQDLGLTFRHAGRDVLLGLGTALALILVVGILEAALRAVGVEQTQSRLYEGIRGAPLWQYVLLLAGGAVLAPLAEESFFRGYVFTACLREKGPWQAYLFSAGLFAVAHLNLPALLPIFVLGLGFAFVKARTGSLLPTMVAHALNNTMALSVLYFSPSLPG